MIRGSLLFLLLSASLAVGYGLAEFLPLSFSELPVLLLAAVLLLLAFYYLRRGWMAWTALTFFFILLGLLRASLPDVRLVPSSMVEWGMGFSRSVVRLIRTVGLPSSTTALLEALLLGQRGGVSESTLQLYRLSGAGHILALSGLHLGVIFGLMHFGLLHLIGSRLRYAFGWLGILLMWGYALATGFPSSLCRASVMLTFMFLGQMRLGGSDSWHNLGLAAFLLLLQSPTSLYDVGFQLSFAGVSGLLLFYPALSSVWLPESRAWRWLWQGWLVSCAAQVGVLPLLLHYFRYFSLSSFLFSPFYVLLTTLIVYAALLMLLFRLVGLGTWLALGIHWLVVAQQGLMSLALRIPFDRVEVATFPWSKVLLLYSSVLCLLPSIHALRHREFELPLQRFAYFCRTWPYLLSSLLLATVLFLLP